MTKRPGRLSPEIRKRIDEFVETVDARLASNEDTQTLSKGVLTQLHGDSEIHDRWQSGSRISIDEHVRVDVYDFVA